MVFEVEDGVSVDRWCGGGGSRGETVSSSVCSAGREDIPWISEGVDEGTTVGRAGVGDSCLSGGWIGCCCKDGNVATHNLVSIGKACRS